VKFLRFGQIQDEMGRAPLVSAKEGGFGRAEAAKWCKTPLSSRGSIFFMHGRREMIKQTSILESSYSGSVYSDRTEYPINPIFPPLAFPQFNSHYLISPLRTSFNFCFHLGILSLVGNRILHVVHKSSTTEQSSRTDRTSLHGHRSGATSRG
jgi:hypothetical protein